MQSLQALSKSHLFLDTLIIDEIINFYRDAIKSHRNQMLAMVATSPPESGPLTPTCPQTDPDPHRTATTPPIPKFRSNSRSSLRTGARFCETSTACRPTSTTCRSCTGQPRNKDEGAPHHRRLHHLRLGAPRTCTTTNVNTPASRAARSSARRPPRSSSCSCRRATSGRGV